MNWILKWGTTLFMSFVINTLIIDLYGKSWKQFLIYLGIVIPMIVIYHACLKIEMKELN